MLFQAKKPYCELCGKITIIGVWVYQRGQVALICPPCHEEVFKTLIEVGKKQKEAKKSRNAAYAGIEKAKG